MSQKIQNVVQVSSQMMVEIYKHPLHMAVTRPPRTDVSDVDDVLHLCDSINDQSGASDFVVVSIVCRRLAD